MATPDEELRSRHLHDVPMSMLEEQFQNVLAKSSSTCDVEYGNRADDGALVFHFFPPGYGLDERSEWPDWHAFRDRLEQAMLGSFALSGITAGYAEELKSFFVIVKPPPPAIDLTALIAKFLAALEGGS